MAHLKSSESKKIVAENQEKLYHLSKSKYPNITHYLSGSVYYTMLNVLKFIKTVNVIIYKHKYVFFLDNGNLTYKVRMKNGGTATSSRHINLLCAIGLINKQFQSEHDMLHINKEFLKSNPEKKRPVNAFYFRRYSDRELQRCEERAERLKTAGVTAGNISFNTLSLNGLADIAREVYPMNNRTAPEKKAAEFEQLIQVMQFLVDRQGYASKQQIRDNLVLEESEIDKLFQIYRKQLTEIYNYKMPTKKQKEYWQLPDNKYIYTLKEK